MIIYVWYEHLSTFLTCNVCISLEGCKEHVSSATQPNGKIHNTYKTFIHPERHRQHRNTWEPWADWGYWVQMCYKQPQGKYLLKWNFFFAFSSWGEQRSQAASYLHNRLNERSCQSKRWTYIAWDIAIISATVS